MKTAPCTRNRTLVAVGDIREFFQEGFSAGPAETNTLRRRRRSRPVDTHRTPPPPAIGQRHRADLDRSLLTSVTITYDFVYHFYYFFFLRHLPLLRLVLKLTVVHYRPGRSPGPGDEFPSRPPPLVCTRIKI